MFENLGELDPVLTAESVPHMIENETLIDVLEYDDLIRVLKYAKLSADQAISVLRLSKNNYEHDKRLCIFSSLNIDFYDDIKTNFDKLVEFLTASDPILKIKCFSQIIDIITSLTDVINSKKEQIGKLKNEIRRMNTEITEYAKQCAEPKRESSFRSFLEHNKTKTTDIIISKENLPKPAANIDYDIENIKIVLVGDSQAGKTCFASRFKNDQFNESQPPTLSPNFISKIYEMSGRTLKLNIYDTLGLASFRSITQSFCNGADGIMLMYSVNNLDTFRSLENWMNYVGWKHV